MFARSRSLQLARGLLARRDRPPLDSLAREQDPETFVWRILPHAARTFAASIVVLPRRRALAAAVAYLYCRMLDTYEDLDPNRDRARRLRRFGERFADEPPRRPEPIAPELAVGPRDRLHLVLVERCALVDSVYATLGEGARQAIRELVHAMGSGMAWAAETFARQGGVLIDSSQVTAYCGHVMGNPVLFALRLTQEDEPSPEQRADAMVAGEMIQLANITRDLERDLRRGVSYRPELAPWLGSAPVTPEARETVRRVRAALLCRALGLIPAYRRLASTPAILASPTARAAAVLMLLFTDLYYRSCAERSGHRAWQGLPGRFGAVLGAFPALLSRRAAERCFARIERRFLAAAARLEPTVAVFESSPAPPPATP